MFVRCRSQSEHERKKEQRQKEDYTGHNSQSCLLDVYAQLYHAVMSANVCAQLYHMLNFTLTLTPSLSFLP